jgi:Cu(I)/Ag(I) efflux system membrane protein CusA/SilA
MIAATIIAVTLVPVLCTMLLGGRVHSEEDNIVMRALHAIYRPILNVALSHRVITLLLAAAFFAVALFLATRIGNAFMPQLNEGDLMYMPITDPSISIDEALRVMKMQDEALRSFPEVEWVVGKAGRADTSTDPAPSI